MKKINLPNLLTIFRMILVVPFIILMSFAIKYTSSTTEINYSNITSSNNPTVFYLASGLIFALAMLTDYIDGKIARKNNLVTTFGKVFDPIADKIMTTTCLIMMTILNIIPFWIVLIFVSRDIMVDGLRNLAASNNKDVSASIWGKLKTMVQSVAIVILFAVYPAYSFGDLNSIWGFVNWRLFLLYTPLLISLILSVFSGYKYIINLKEFIKLI